jgi:glycosyltransferase involved in cell wall biosynthesis
MTTPLVSVVIPVYNGAADVRSAIESILKQTFQDFEMIVINDGSKDNSAEVIESIPDKRIRVFHQDNIGLAATLNRGISKARGRYIARLDQDDISLPARLERQVEFIEAHPDCALLGTRAIIWEGDRQTDRVHDHPADDASLKFELLFNNPFVHASVMMRKSVLEELGGYAVDPDRQPPEDYELWSRISRKYKVANIPERLTIYREVPKSMSRTQANLLLDRLVTINAENMAATIGVNEPTQDMFDIAGLIHMAFYRISKRPNIKRMCEIVTDAGKKILDTAPESDVSERMELMIKRLNQQYRFFRYDANWLRHFVYSIRVAKQRGLTKILRLGSELFHKI